MALNLRQLEYLVAAVSTGSMTAAGERLGVSQSAVSIAISELESLTGAQLVFRRGAQGLIATDAGGRLLVEARELLALAERVEANARNVGLGLSGHLVVGCFRTAAPFLLPSLLEGFAERFPDVRLDFFEGDSPQVEAELLSGRCEVALLYDMDLSPRMQVDPLYSTAPYVLVGQEHPLADRDEVSIVELADHDMVQLDVPPSAAYFESIFDGEGVEMRVRHRTSSYELVRALVARGLGYALLLSRPVVDESYEGLPIVCLPIAGQPRSIDVVLARPVNSGLTVRAQAFVEHCHEVLPVNGLNALS